MSAKPEYYLVGGAVRDSLLGIEVKDRDFVVVGATPEWMLEQGFRQVGRDFPVFLHPATGEEYALARTERKSGHGYGGFTVWADPEVTLEQDLQRRDLTINAMAKDPQGRLIDPFGGQRDLEQGVLRHVSPAFAEDPLRVLRVARFMARFADRGFTLADETLALMQRIVRAGELEHLTPERAWQEMRGALLESRPDRFIETLRHCGALERILPEVEILFGVPQPPAYHPEIDTGVHTLMVLRIAAELSPELEVRFAALLHDLGKGLTPSAELPRHVGHEARGIRPVEQVCARFRVPKSCERLALVVCRHHLLMHQLAKLKPSTVLRLIKSMDGVRRPQQVESFAMACEADSRGRTGREHLPYPQRELLMHYTRALRELDLSDVGKFAGRPGGIPAEVERRQLEVLTAIKQSLRVET